MPRWPALVRRARRPGPIFWDSALALALAVVSLGGAEISSGSEDVQHPVPPSSAEQPLPPPTVDSDPLWIVVPLILVATLPVALRRRYPIAVLGVMLSATLAL